MRSITNQWTPLLALALMAFVMTFGPSDAFACRSQVSGGHEHDVGVSDGPDHDKGAGALTSTYYVCPMPEHSDVRSNQPGTCPRCGMKLVAKSGADTAPSADAIPAGEEQRRHAH